MRSDIQAINFPQLLIDHFYLGLIITLFYIGISPYIIEQGYPGMSILLIAELMILLPLVLIHLLWYARKKGPGYTWRKIFPYREKLTVKQFMLWTLTGVLICFLVYVPLYPLGLYFRKTIFAWLPEWYFNPIYGTEDLNIIANVFLLAIFIDGIVGPIAEELFFRGFLLPRMAYLKKWAPIVNGAFFGLYHFWQPHNFLALIAIGIVLSYIVWRTKNVYLGIAIHCLINIMGAVSGYLAVSGGVMIGR